MTSLAKSSGGRHFLKISQSLPHYHSFNLARRRVAALLLGDSCRGSQGRDELDVLGILIAAYCRKHFSVEPGDPVTALQIAMDQHRMEPHLPDE
jgi:antitoxin component HigA of HigAB toxin-antitoxin module